MEVVKGDLRTAFTPQTAMWRWAYQLQRLQDLMVNFVRCGCVVGISEMPTFYQNYLAMSNTADMTGGKPIAI
jgi:hypothetical protein